MISKNVMKTSEWGDAVYYKLDCDCHSDDHSTTIEFEKDPDTDKIFLLFYKKMSWDAYWGSSPWYKRIWKRFTASAKMLFTGWIEVETEVIIGDEEHINAFIEALQEGKQKFNK